MKEIDFEKIGRKLKEIRLSKGLTQEYVANAADVNTSHISNIENNRVRISLPTLVYVCNALNVTVDYVLSDEYLDTSSVLDEEILRHLQTCPVNTKNRFCRSFRFCSDGLSIALSHKLCGITEAQLKSALFRYHRDLI